MVLTIFIILTVCFLLIPGIYLFWDYNSENIKQKKQNSNKVNDY